MSLARLLRDLARPGAYPHPAEAVEVRQTHISVVFLAGPFAYKVKKPVALGFVDYSTLDRRRHFCEEEIRLNRRLAPAVYLDVVPITAGADGLCAGGAGPPIEWAVRMVRLPDDATLGARLAAGAVPARVLEDLGRRLAAFHAAAPAMDPATGFGRFTTVAANCRDNFAVVAADVGVTLDAVVVERARRLTEVALADAQSRIEGRAAAGRVRDVHGDLRLDHVYLFPDRTPPDDLAIVDCIEFNARYRCIDPVADVAFLLMDCGLRGHVEAARTLREAWFAASGDAEGRALLPLYLAYRAAVRGKVETLKAREPEVPPDARAAARAAATKFFAYAGDVLGGDAGAP